MNAPEGVREMTIGIVAIMATAHSFDRHYLRERLCAVGAEPPSHEVIRRHVQSAINLGLVEETEEPTLGPFGKPSQYKWIGM